MPHLIFTRRPDACALTPDEIHQRAPSVYATDKAPHLTERYGQVTTGQAVSILADFGFFPVQAAQVGKSRHAKHMLAFSDLSTTGDRPELILYNSHNGTSALKMFAGFFRMICSNGIVAGEGFQSRMLHNLDSVSHFETLITGTASKLPELSDRIERMRSTPMSQGDALEFIKVGATYRWAENRITDNTIADIYQPRRSGDDQHDMWSIFNRVQEGLVRGGVRVGPHDRKARAIGSIQQNLRINQDLWNLTTGVSK